MRILINSFKGLLSIVSCLVASYLFWLLFLWLSPKVVDLSWWWLAGYVFIITAVVSFLVVAMSGMVTAFLKLLIKYKVFTVINLIIIAFWGISSICIPWRFIGDMTFRAFLWGLILNINALELFGLLIAGLFIKTE